MERDACKNYTLSAEKSLYFLRGSQQECSIKQVLLENSQNSQENTCARVFFKKVQGLSPATLLKKRLWHRCFLVNFTKFLRTSFLQNTSGRCFWTMIYLLWIIYVSVWRKLDIKKDWNRNRDELLERWSWWVFLFSNVIARW